MVSWLLYVCFALNFSIKNGGNSAVIRSSNPATWSVNKVDEARVSVARGVD
jgi:hypothetical protein